LWKDLKLGVQVQKLITYQSGSYSGQKNEPKLLNIYLKLSFPQKVVTPDTESKAHIPLPLTGLKDWIVLQNKQ